MLMCEVGDGFSQAVAQVLLTWLGCPQDFSKNSEEFQFKLNNNQTSILKTYSVLLYCLFAYKVQVVIQALPS
jgi:hypothetical protein